MSALNMTAEGFAALEKKMEEVKKQVENRNKINAQAVLETEKWIQRNFEQEGKPVGGWVDLAASTKIIKAAEGKVPYKILHDRAYLKNQWKKYWDKDAAWIESKMDYAAKHHYGDKASRLPARQILPDDAHIWPILQKLYDLWIRGILK